MGKYKNLEYKIIDETLHCGEGHIINIAKRHTNRRWRQYTPEKQCLIQIELVKTAFIHAIQLKGFGTYVIEITFKDLNEALVTQLMFNLNFEEQQINQPIVCDQQVKYVDLKLINSETNPKRMGINHFFVKGETSKNNGSESEDEKKEKRKRGPKQIWVREKIQHKYPQALDQISSELDPQVHNDSLKEGVSIEKTFRSNSHEIPNQPYLKTSNENSCKNYKRQLSSRQQVNPLFLSVSDKIQEMSGTKKKKRDQHFQIDSEKVLITSPSKNNHESELLYRSPPQNKKQYFRNFEQKFGLKKNSESSSVDIQSKNIQSSQPLEIKTNNFLDPKLIIVKRLDSAINPRKSDENQIKNRVKLQLIKLLQEKVNCKEKKLST